MTLRRKRNALRLLAVALALAALGVGAQAWRTPPTTAQLPPVKSPRTADAFHKETLSKKPLSADENLWKKPLRRPIFDPPPPPPPEVVKKELPPIRAKLLGTILEPGNSQAMIAQPGGAVEFRTVGQPLGPQDDTATIVEITAVTVRVKRGEELTTLTVEGSSP
jgi:hypothetical protein